MIKIKNDIILFKIGILYKVDFNFNFTIQTEMESLQN